MPKWTNEQLDAINKENTNIIVSAGAGSGKTAVLTERVIRKLRGGVNVNELLVLTFTNAAAFEMKERIRDAIKEDKSLEKQLSLVDGAYITTFDSFSLLMVKKYHYLLNISKNINICDSSIITVKKTSFIDEIFDEMYELEDEDFLNLINDFCIKSDKEIKKYILEINNKLDLKYDKEEYLNNYIENFYNDKKVDEDINEFNKYLINKIKEINKNITYLSNHVDIDYTHKITELFSGLLSSNNYDDIVKNINIKLPILTKKCDEEAKKYKDNISSILKRLEEVCIYKDISSIKESVLSTKTYVKAIIKVINKLDKKITDMKYKSNMFEFNDISKMAIKILKENKNVCEELKHSFNEIMVDEYQDTSDLQEVFISLIENNNVYQVGDIKQSIYRFRNANPYIFKNKYDNYSKDIGGYKIDLNRNFRSRKETLDNINIIFNVIMDDLIGGANYIESHQMIFGNNSYIEKGTTDQNNDFEIYNYEKVEGFSKEETEAFIIANDIKEKVNNKYLVFDKKTSSLRECRYSDFVVLMDRVKYFDLYKKIFEYLNIPLTKKADTSITNSTDFLLIKNIIGLVINVYKKENNIDLKYNFTSVARSFLFSYLDAEIFDLVTNNNIYSSELIKKIEVISNNLENKSINEILDNIIDELDFYNKLVLVGDIDLSMIRLEYIYNLASTCSEFGYNIFEFYEYLSNLIENDIGIKVDISENTKDSVSIMNIHKSKGLEFPICYYALLHAPFNVSERNEKMLYSDKYGIITPYFNEGICNTFYKELFKENYMNEEISEKIRLFYVALTRCREKMILVTSIKNETDIVDNMVSIDNRLKYKSFLSILNSVYDVISKYIKDIDINKINLSKDYNLIKETNYKDNIEKVDYKINNIDLSIDNTKVESKKFSKNTGLIDKSTRDKMKYGEYIHYIFELIDFKNPDLSILDETVKKYVNNFLNQDIDFLNCNIYKEYEFVYNDNNVTYNGIIDLMLEYKNEVFIIDYKLSNIMDDNYLEQLNGYKKYIENKMNKRVRIYLYSIMKNELKELA